MLTKLTFYEQQSFAMFGINNSDFFALSDQEYQRAKLFSILVQTKSSFVTPDFQKRQNKNETSLKLNQIYWNNCFFGDTIINTCSTESSNQTNAKAKDDAHKK